MKKNIILPLLLLFTTVSFSQQIVQKKSLTKVDYLQKSKKQKADGWILSLTKQDYLQKSKKQKKAAWIMLGGGATLLLTGILIPKGEPSEYNAVTNIGNIFWVIGPPETVYKNDRIKRIAGITGVLSMLGSIHFFIAAGKNNRKAMKVSFKNETAPQILKSSYVNRSVPSLSFNIRL